MGTPVLAIGIGAFAAIQGVGMVFALTVLPRHCGIWDRAGSLATNGLMFGLLLSILTRISGGSPATVWLAFVLSVVVTILDANRRLRPRCATVSTRRHGQIALPMAHSDGMDNTVLRCVRCERKSPEAGFNGRYGKGTSSAGHNKTFPS
ncbi:MAG: hypothetical protein H8F28_27805 [Fibrella sp.]|nr:hypothetical protein [Armatimonadota bacterium]